MISFNNLGNLGRLGNQMFQYASLLGIAKNNNYDFCIPPSRVFGMHDEKVRESGLCLDSLFNLTCERAILDNPIIHEPHFHFSYDFFNNLPDNSDISGYFQSEKYFINVENEIRKEFSFKEEIIEAGEKYLSNPEETISLHVRRGDYLSLSDFHPIQPESYYSSAISLLPELPILVFSDDKDWCKNQKLFQADRFIFIDNPPNLDLFLMSRCGYHIIANSSFSWWGSWLSKSKKTIAPKNWFGPALNSAYTGDLYSEKWVIV